MKQVLLLLGMSLTYADLTELLGGDDQDTDSMVVDETSVSDFLGSETDEHDCIPTAGEIWCEQLNKCVQPFVEACDEEETEETPSLEDVLNSIIGPGDHIPNFGNEGSLSESEDDESDDSTVTMFGGDHDDNDCIASAGYTWCEKKSECVRSWMLEGEWEDECTVETTTVGGNVDDNNCLTSAGYTWCEKKNECVRSWMLEGEWDDECTTETTSESSSGSSSSSEGTSSESSSEGSSSSSSEQPGASESTQDDLAKFFYNDDGTLKPWVFKVFLCLSITAAVLLVCLIRSRRLRKRRRRRSRSVGVQMLATETDNYARFNGDGSNFVFQETVAVKTSGKDDVPSRREFTNLV